jgi:uncharacterized repeat protein (TIGR04138 family)
MFGILQMSADDTVLTNLFCRSCAYNLRGLCFFGLFPECAEPIQNSLDSAISHISLVLREDRVNIANRFRFERIAEEIGRPVDGLMFIRDSITFIQSKKPGVNLTAKDVCDGIRAHARKYFNDENEARELLAEWGVTSGEAMGEMVFGLVRHGLLQASEGETVEQFAGQFDLERLFD